MKKFICLLIVALMLCSFVPCAFAETVEDYVFSNFESEGEIHKWGSGWNDTLLYYTEEGAAGYPDGNNKTVTLTIDGKQTTLYGRYVTTADSTVTRPGSDYSLKWDKIGKKAPGGAFRDSDEANGRIESHGILDKKYHLHTDLVYVIIGIHLVFKQLYDGKQQVDIAEPAEYIVYCRKVLFCKAT